MASLASLNASHVALQWSKFGPYHHARVRAARALAEARGVRLTAFETAGRDAVYGWADDAETAAGHVQVFPGETFETLAPRRIVRGVTAMLDRLDPDAVAINSYSAPDAQAALVWCRRHRRVAVCMMESKADDAARSQLRERLKGRLVRQFDAALAGGTPQRAYLRQLGVPDSVIFQPYDVVDNAFFRDGAQAAQRSPAASRALPGLGDPTPFFLASNRFVARKNLPALLRAYGRYRQRAAAAGDAPWRLVMLGDGPQRAALDRLAAAVGGVTFAGFRPLAELPAYYGRAGAFVHVPLVEPWGLVVNEALAAGRPVVVSRGAGCAPDLVRDGETGFAVDPADEAALADRLAQVAAMTQDARDAMGRCGQAVVAQWSPARFAEGLLDAVEAGGARADRGMDPIARAFLAALWTVSRRVDSFLAVPE